MTRYGDQWKAWPMGADVTNGTEHGVIVRSAFEVRGVYQPMVKIAEGPRVGKRVWPWEKPRWRVMSEGEAELAHAQRDDQRQAADHAGDAIDTTRTRDGRVAMPRWSPEFQRKLPKVRDNATPEQRARVDSGRVAAGDEPF